MKSYEVEVNGEDIIIQASNPMTAVARAMRAYKKEVGRRVRTWTVRLWD